MILHCGQLSGNKKAEKSRSLLERGREVLPIRHVKGEEGYSPMTFLKNAKALPPVILTMSASE